MFARERLSPIWGEVKALRSARELFREAWEEVKLSEFVAMQSRETVAAEFTTNNNFA